MHLFVRLLTPLALVYCALEYAIHLLMHLPAIRTAEFVYVLWFWSFGHQALDLHILAMRFRGRRLVVLMSDYENFNRPLVGLFTDLVHIEFLRHTPLMRRLVSSGAAPVEPLDWLKKALLAFLLRFLTNPPMLVRQMIESGPPVSANYAVNYIRLLHSDSALAIKPRETQLDGVREALRRARPDLAERWCAALYVRKRRGDPTDFRAVPQRIYAASIRRINELDGFVFCGGDAEPQGFADMGGWLTYRDLPVSRSLVDLYFLSQPRFVIMGVSGTLAVATLFGVPILIVNSPYFYYSGLRANQRIIFREVWDERRGRFLRADELFALPVVGYQGEHHFTANGLRLVDNTETEILAATEEMAREYVLGEGTATPSDLALLKRYRSILPDESLGRVSPARPTWSYLRSIGW